MAKRGFREIALGAAAAIAGFLATPALAQETPPNILVIWGDDIGYWNVSYNSRGMMGYETPNIDRIANEGAIFTDYYGEQSCTAGRAAFITGQSGIRTGLLKVGFPGAEVGLQPEDPTIAALLKNHGYRTGQFGKNHLGDRNEYLPTVHGFDEFYGNLYHLNAEEEPEHPSYPDDPAFRERFGPRGVLRCTASETESEVVDDRFGPMGKQTCEDTGPLTIERMKSVDQEFLKASLAFIEEAHAAGEPFFVWHNATRMHYYTHIGDDYAGRSGLNFYADGMLEHDDDVGVLLDKLEELGIADNTIVLYSTDNGPHYNQWPDGGITPFRGEKNTNWEGGFRVPAAVRWPGVVEPGTVLNGLVSHNDWLPTLLAAAGEPDIKEKLLAGHEADGRSFRVHLDGFDMSEYLAGRTEESPRKAFFYFSDDGELLGLRFDRYKAVFAEQRAHGFAVWRDPFVKLRAPKIFDMRMDPFERGDTDSNNWNEWWSRHAWALVPMQAFVAEKIATLAEFPPRQKPAAFNLDQVLQSMQDPSTQ
jgi:arylsulfatase A-like enzyme